MKVLLRRMRRGISQAVGDHRLQLRLQVGSSAALAAGLIVVVLFALKFLANWNDPLFYILVGSPQPSMIQQDTLAQIVIIFLLALLGGATLPHFRFLSASALMLLYVVFYLSYTIEKFNGGTIVQPLYPLVALWLTFASVMVFRRFAEDRPRESVGNFFRRYVSVDAMDQVLKRYDQNTLPVSGTRREVSALHIDLRALSVLADTLAPQTAVNLVNDYFRAIIPIIFQNSGTVFKQSGNGILAVWNLPLEDPSHADDAVRAAMQIRRKLAPMQAVRSLENGQAGIQIGFGIATGDVIGAHIGVPSHEEYTIIGEIATVAERLAMKPDRGIFIDHATREELVGQFELKDANPVRLRRKTDPFSVWEVVEPLELAPMPVELAELAK